MQDGWIATPGNDINKALIPFGITYGDIITLRDLGLMIDGDHIHKDFRPSQPPTDIEKHRVVIVNNGKLIELSGPGTPNLQIQALLFSKVGRELQHLIDPSPSIEYFKALGTHLKSRAVTAKLGKTILLDGVQSIIAFDEEMADISASAP